MEKEYNEIHCQLDANQRAYKIKKNRKKKEEVNILYPHCNPADINN